jgi:hypothetical protein
MITPEEIKKRALRFWISGRPFEARCAGENIFPVDIPFGKIGGSSVSENFSASSDWVRSLIDGSKEKKGAGYSIEFREVAHRQLGRQRMPQRIFIETENDLLKLCGKTKEFKLFMEACRVSEHKLPELTGFIARETVKLIPFFAVWEKLTDVCLYFIENPDRPLYIRQIVIPGVDTKFIESHKKIISEMLIYLKPDRYMLPFPAPASGGFEKYFGLRYDEPMIRFRILDEEIYINGLSDITLPLTHFHLSDERIKRVFITENKINGLAFPMVKNSIVIFGLGYGVSVLEEVLWLKNCEIFYWGDIDTHGFSILSKVRKIFPGCVSFLMDEAVLAAHVDICVEEPEFKRFTGTLSGLTQNEAQLFEDLKNNRFGIRLRLEQEMIPFDYVVRVVDRISANRISRRSPLHL